MTQKNSKYVVHYCKNRTCNSCWLDTDLTNAQSRPPRWKYCEKCCKNYGYKNPQTPPKKELSKAQWETIEENQFTKRKKSTRRTVNISEVGKDAGN